MKIRMLVLITLLCFCYPAAAQTLYVDAARGNDSYAGSKTSPLATIERAVAMSRRFSGDQPINIKLFPGLYTISRQIIIDSLPLANDTALFTIEAMLLPGDSSWDPSLMPVIQSVSANNKDYGKFNHCIGFQVERGHVALRGLKFTGNANPSVQYYYPIERHKPYLSGLRLSHCLFVGKPHSAPIQGALFAQGPDIKVEHCTFYNCKNVILCFVNIKGFSLTYSIIYGAYEAAVRLGYKTDADLPFIFHHNIIAASAWAWLGDKQPHHYYLFEDAVFTDNDHFIGYNTDPVEEDRQSPIVEKRVLHDGHILFDDTLRLLPASAGYQLRAGF